jgi:purine-binding chemotaxis protein CheW
MGLLVDPVSEVLRTPPGIIEPAPRIASDINGESIKRIAKLEDRPVILIDMDRLMEKS